MTRECIAEQGHQCCLNLPFQDYALEKRLEINVPKTKSRQQTWPHSSVYILPVTAFTARQSWELWQSLASCSTKLVYMLSSPLQKTYINLQSRSQWLECCFSETNKYTMVPAKNNTQSIGRRLFSMPQAVLCNIQYTGLIFNLSFKGI